MYRKFSKPKKIVIVIKVAIRINISVDKLIVGSINPGKT